MDDKEGKGKGKGVILVFVLPDHSVARFTSFHLNVEPQAHIKRNITSELLL